MPAGVPRRVGFMGGTFDPVHVGHLAAAVEVRHQLGLDRLLMVVANEPWQKVRTRAVTPGEDRLAVLEAAIGGAEGLEASSLEIDRGGPSYSVETAEELRRSWPGAELFMVVGADVAAELHTWERAGELAAMVTLVVMNRSQDRALPTRPGWRTIAVEVPSIDLSSSQVRERMRAGRPIDFLVPAAGIRCIRRRGMYSGDR